MALVWPGVEYQGGVRGFDPGIIAGLETSAYEKRKRVCRSPPVRGRERPRVGAPFRAINQLATFVRPRVEDPPFVGPHVEDPENAQPLSVRQVRIGELTTVGGPIER